MLNILHTAKTTSIFSYLWATKHFTLLFCVHFRYNTMRVDPSLCYLERCGGPPEESLEEKKIQDQDENSKLDEDEEDR